LKEFTLGSITHFTTHRLHPHPEAGEVSGVASAF
jgi:hypothetical protein